MGALRALAERARAGQGGVAVVEGSAGLGKTALLRRLRDELDEDEVGVLSALGGELEREFPFGLVRQLFEPTVLRADPERRERLLGGAAALAAPVVGAAPEPGGAGADAVFATLHGLYWLTAALAEERPLVLVIDDAHWGDAPSLRFLDFLARRVDELPVLVCVGMRPDEPDAEHGLLASLTESPHATSTSLGPLSRDGAGALVAEALGAAVPAPVIEAAVDATGGNPLLLRELLRTLTETGAPPTADAVREAIPSSVTRSVERRLGRLDADARRLAHALAVLGDGRGTGLAAATAATGLTVDAAGAALDVLRGVGLVEDEPPRFTHPLLRTAVAEAMPVAQRAALHREAARRLRETGGGDRVVEELVLHLLAAPPTGEDWTVDPLRRSAQRALGEGAPDAAVRRLRRALDELPPFDERRDALTLEAALAAAAAGDPGVVELAAAAGAAEDPEIAGRGLSLSTVISTGMDEGVGMIATARALEAVVARLDAPEQRPLRDSLRAQLYNAIVVDTRLIDERRRVIDDIIAAPADPLLGILAFEAAATDATAAEALDLVRRALAFAPLDSLVALEESTPFWAVIAAYTVEGGDLADTALRDAELVVRSGVTRVGNALALFMRAEWALVFGTAEQAEVAAREAIGLFEQAQLTTAALGVRSSLARALLRLNRLDEASAILDEMGDLTHRFVFGSATSVGAEILLARRRPAEALPVLEAVRDFASLHGWRRMPIGLHAQNHALALALTGERDRARELAEAEIAEARRRGTPLFEAEAGIALGHALEGDAALAAFAAAAEAGERTASLHTRANAHFEHGAALRRANRRAEARAELAEARDLAARSGSVLLGERATEELVLAGGRPRRTALTGVESLTPSERRVAEHAASGLTNREIAEALFITRKTVEYTLGRAFAKLDVKSRTQLAGLF